MEITPPIYLHAAVNSALQLLRLLGERRFLHVPPHDLSLGDARRFATALAEMSILDQVKQLLERDPEGARAFLAVAADEDTADCIRRVPLVVSGQEAYRTFFPVAAWLLAAIDERETNNAA